jgi:SAM-dependent methyltransferase
MRVTDETVREHFDQQIRRGRRLIPDPGTVGGFGTYVKYCHVADLMTEPRFRTILDLGCNRGSIEYLYETKYPRSPAGKRIVGVDTSWIAIERASSLSLSVASFLTADGCNLPFHDQSFDLVTLIEVIEHVQDKRALLFEIARVLRPGGRLLLTTPNPDCWALRIEQVMWKVIRRILRKKQAPKDVFIDVSTLQDLLQAKGFRILDQTKRYSWPRAFIHFRGWSLFPPLSPSLLMRYQQLWIEVLDHRDLVPFLERRLMWTARLYAELG